jgi:predicted nucleic acid-binding protein
MITSDIALLDSNILIYAHQSLSKFHQPSKSLRDRAMAGEIQICICPQVLMEFYAVITNSKRVTNPILPEDAMNEVVKYFQSKQILKIYSREDLLLKIIDLARKYKVEKHEIFDLQIVATMLSNGISKLYTYNYDHFARFTELEVLIP